MTSSVKSEKAERRSAQGRLEPTSDVAELHRRLGEDPRFNPPTPSVWKRVALVVLVLGLFWVGISMRKQMSQAKNPDVVYASRYSKEHKFRPAASPIITERMADGRLKVRGAQPTVR
ncbi:hypothetical protein PsYK624_017160 [Phanerochaete sordida]|uniref:Uncharacterized protein n=1 Tax=Phanerochaete sordida TaxID=48140 RepID=A0A9P3G019_9APHY|nr:hypothetical protein PsYK624_017160 [Phanerochaete sordida]